MKGARYIVLGTITSYDSSTNLERKGRGMSNLGFGGNKQSTVTQDYVAIDVRVVDSTTDEVGGGPHGGGPSQQLGRAEIKRGQPIARSRHSWSSGAHEPGRLCGHRGGGHPQLLQERHHRHAHAGGEGESP